MDIIPVETKNRRVYGFNEHNNKHKTYLAIVYIVGTYTTYYIRPLTTIDRCLISPFSRFFFNVLFVLKLCSVCVRSGN